MPRPSASEEIDRYRRVFGTVGVANIPVLVLNRRHFVRGCV